MKAKTCGLVLMMLAVLGVRAEYPDRFVEYIESDGSQYIDLGDVLRSNTVAVIDFMRISTDTVERPMFGADYCFAYLSTTRRYVRGKLGYSGPVADERFLHRYDVAAQKIHQSTDGGTTWSQVSANNSKEGGEGAGADAYLFWASGSTKSKAAMRLYGCSITNGTSLACDLYPCVKDGAPGLYDAVTGDILFDSSASATAFAVGPDTDIPPACLSCGYEIKGVPSRWGTSVPAYGIDACEKGTSVSFALNGLDGEGWVLSADGKCRVRFVGATYRPYGSEAEEINASSFTRTLSGVVQVLWKFEDEHRACVINASAVGEATYLVDGTVVTPGETVWVAAGSSVTVKAVPAFGFSFVKWTDGEHDLGTEPEITVTPGSAGVSLTPVLRPCVCVNKDSKSAVEDGSPLNPYKTIQAGINAVAEDGVEVIVSADAYPAVYGISAPLANNANFTVRIRGWTGNPRDIVIDANGACRCLTLDNATTVEAVTLTNGFDAVKGGGALLLGGAVLRNSVVTGCKVESDTAGTQISGGGVGVGGGAVVSDCLIENCEVLHGGGSASDYAYGGGVSLGGHNGGDGRGTLSNAVVRNCRLVQKNHGGSVGYAYGGGVFVNTTASKEADMSLVYGTVIEQCCVTNLATFKSTRCQGGGAYLTSRGGALGSQIRNCRIAGCWSSCNGGGVFFSKGTGYDLTVTGNVARADGAGAYMAGQSSALRNSLVAANEGESAAYLTADSLSLQSCTIAGNACTGIALNAADGCENVRISNTIVSRNTCTAQIAAALDVGGAYAANVTTSFVGGDPKFVSRSRGDYRLRYGSPCRGQGLVEAWMTNAKALDGSPRIDPEDGTVDIGCYQHTPFVGLSILVR